MIKGSALFKLKHCLTSILFGSFNRVQHIPAAFSSQSDVPLTKWSRCSLQRGTHPDHNFVLATENLEQERRLQGKFALPPLGTVCVNESKPNRVHCVSNDRRENIYHAASYIDLKKSGCIQSPFSVSYRERWTNKSFFVQASILHTRIHILFLFFFPFFSLSIPQFKRCDYV